MSPFPAIGFGEQLNPFPVSPNVAAKITKVPGMLITRLVRGIAGLGRFIDLDTVPRTGSPLPEGKPGIAALMQDEAQLCDPYAVPGPLKSAD